MASGFESPEGRSIPGLRQSSATSSGTRLGGVGSSASSATRAGQATPVGQPARSHGNRALFPSLRIPSASTFEVAYDIRPIWRLRFFWRRGSARVQPDRDGRLASRAPLINGLRQSPREFAGRGGGQLIPHTGHGVRGEVLGGGIIGGNRRSGGQRQCLFHGASPTCGGTSAAHDLPDHEP